MKNDKVCISKGVGYLSLAFIVLIVAALLAGNLTNRQTSTNTRAALEGATQQYCSSNNLPNNNGKSTPSKIKYYRKLVDGVLRFYKYEDANPKDEIRDINYFCRLATPVAYKCVKSGYDCKRPLYRKAVSYENGTGNGSVKLKGDSITGAIGNNFVGYEKYYADPSCMGLILPQDTSIIVELTSVASSDKVRNAYCESKDKVRLQYECPASYIGMQYYSDGLGNYYRDIDLTEKIADFGVGNMCAIQNGDKIPQSSLNPVSCADYFSNFDSAKAAKADKSKIIYADNHDMNNALYLYYEPSKIYAPSAKDAQDYCLSSETLDEFLATHPVKVNCENLFIGGIKEADKKYYAGLRYGGTSIGYLPGSTGDAPLRVLSPKDVCTETRKVISCRDYAAAADVDVADGNYFSSINTVDEIWFNEGRASSSPEDPNVICGFNPRLTFNRK